MVPHTCAPPADGRRILCHHAVNGGFVTGVPDSLEPFVDDFFRCRCFHKLISGLALTSASLRVVLAVDARRNCKDSILCLQDVLGQLRQRFFGITVKHRTILLYEERIFETGEALATATLENDD